VSGFEWDPAGYVERITAEVPLYERLQEELVAATTGIAVATILDLGTGSGETARRLLAAHGGARLVGLDDSAAMLDHARAVLPAERVELRTGRIEEPLPEGPFDLVSSALCVHHLDGPGKVALFEGIAAVLAPGARFVLGDLVVPEDPAQAVTPIDWEYDLPSTVGDQLAWLGAAGLRARVAWAHGDLAVLVGEQRL
jgi:tRNA (cmo5U34)-methyltransferase